MLKKDTKFLWTAECQEAFDEIKNILTTYPILRQPNFKLMFRLYTDASGWALGCILTQTDTDGKEYAICYKSCLLEKR